MAIQESGLSRKERKRRYNRVIGTVYWNTNEYQGHWIPIDELLRCLASQYNPIDKRTAKSIIHSALQHGDLEVRTPPEGESEFRAPRGDLW